MHALIQKSSRLGRRSLPLVMPRRFTQDHLKNNNPITCAPPQPGMAPRSEPTSTSSGLFEHEKKMMEDLQAARFAQVNIKSAANDSIHHASQDLRKTQIVEAKPTEVVTPPKTELPGAPIEERAIQKKKFSVREFIKEEWHKLKISFRQLKADSFRFYLYYLTKEGFDTYTPSEYIDKERVKLDLIKFIPYGIFIVLPFGELLIPPYLGLFPNAVPSQFLNEKSIGKQLKKNEDRQKEAFETLRKKLRPLFKEEYDKVDAIKAQLKGDPFNAELRQQLREIDMQVQGELIRNWHKYQKRLKFSNLSIDEMDYVMKFMFFDYVDGIHIINVLMNFHKKVANFICTKVFKVKPPFNIKRYTLDFFPLNELRKWFLRRQLISQYLRLEREDFLVEQHPRSLEKMKSAELYTFARQRGIKVSEDTDRIRFYHEIWAQDTRNTQKKELKFWMTLSRFAYGKYLV